MKSWLKAVKCWFGTVQGARDLDSVSESASSPDSKDVENCPGREMMMAKPCLEPPSPFYDPDIEKQPSIINPSSPTVYRNLELDQEYSDLSTSYAGRAYRWMRWKFFSAYRRLFTFVLVANLGALVILSVKSLHRMPGLNFANTLTAASVNLATSIVMRNEHIVNLLFLTSSSLKPSLPLWIRCLMAKIYGYGGIHSGCAVAAFVWYLAYSALVVYRSIRPPYVDTPTVSLTGANTLTLLVIVVLTHPKIRFRFHDWFECTHRFAGWTSVALLWAQIVTEGCKLRNRNSVSAMAALATIPPFWCLLVVTVCIAYPWIRIRRRYCTAEPLSQHALRLRFSYDRLPHCSAVRLATNPLKATHAFAAIPEFDSTGGYSVIISNAGDWTGKIIDKPPSKLWVKGAPFYGVLRVAVMFKPVLLIATGSGIGPCLSLFHGVPGLDCRLLWCTPSPTQTYGMKIVEEVIEADPQAIIVDTKKSGRPDLVRLAWDVFKTTACEAAVIISNPSTTEKVVYGLEIRGVPAYGPIFDS